MQLQYNINNTTVPSLQDEWSKFLSQITKFDQFLTLTFKDPVGEELSDKQFSKWLRQVNILLFGKRFRENKLGLTAIKGIEKQMRGAIHFHVLLSGVPKHLDSPSMRDSLCVVWENCHPNNGFANCQTVKNSMSVAKYISKYVSKGGEIDIILNPTHQEQNKLIQTRYNRFVPGNLDHVDGYQAGNDQYTIEEYKRNENRILSGRYQ